MSRRKASSTALDDLDKDTLLTDLDKGLASEAAATTAEPYQPPESLWQLIKSIAPEPEHDTIQAIVGLSLVEQSLELHNEVHTLLDIWRDYRNETQRALGELRRAPKMPEAPNVRDTLKKEIRMFVEQLQQQQQGNKPHHLLSKEHNMHVINYALDKKETTTKIGSSSAVERPASAIDPASGRETPVITGSSSSSRSLSGRNYSHSRMYMTPSRCGSGLSQASSSSSRRVSLSGDNEQAIVAPLNNGTTTSLGAIGGDELERYVDEAKLNCEHIDEVAGHLRQLLEDECATLVRDIELLHECIERECDYRAQSRQEMREPSLGELKRERKLLEEDLLHSAVRVNKKVSQQPHQSPLRRMSRDGEEASTTANTSTRSSPSPTPSSSGKARRNSSSSSTVTNTTTITNPSKPVVIKETITRLKAKPQQPTSLAGLRTTTNKPTSLIRQLSSADSRPNSAGSNTSSSSLSNTAVASRQQTTAEKFRQMVLEYRSKDEHDTTK